MNQPTDAAQPQREIPPLPGGGSWHFDEEAWKWISNDPAPAAEQAAVAGAAAPIEAPAAEQPAEQE
jgi:hypothetical protein